MRPGHVDFLPGAAARSRYPGDPGRFISQRPRGRVTIDPGTPVSPRRDALCSQLPALRGHPVTELWPRASQTHRPNLTWHCAHSPQPTPMRPWTGQKPPLAQDRSQKGPCCRKHRLALPPPPTAPRPAWEAPATADSADAQRETRRTWAGQWSEGSRWPGGSLGSPQAVALPLTSPRPLRAGAGPGPQDVPEDPLSPLTTLAPRSLCCPAPRSPARDRRIWPFSFHQKRESAQPRLCTLPIIIPTAA